jgi:hypothetical protein
MARSIFAAVLKMDHGVFTKTQKKSQMKKLIHNHPRGLTAAIAVLVCCTGAARATVEQNKGTNAIAFSEERGDRSANLVLSTLDLAMMDPVERDNMLASLETQYGKPKAWASRAARATSKSVFGFGRDGEKEKNGVRLRARELPPVFNSEVSNTLPADNARVSEQIASASLLGVSRSEVLTWSANQDRYSGDGPTADSFRYDSNNKWANEGLNYKLQFGNGIYSPTWYGFSIKVKPGADIAGRLEYNQWWYKALKNGRDLGWTRDVTGSGSVGCRVNCAAILSWGHDWNLAWAGHWGIGAEANCTLGLWASFNVNMNSSNTKAGDDTLSAGASVGPYVEAQGTAWIGKTEHKNADDDTWNSESHKLVNGARAQIVFQGTATVGLASTIRDKDWYNDKWNNDMTSEGNVGNTRANGKLVARAEFRWGPVTFQQGYQIWSGTKENSGWVQGRSAENYSATDALL